VFLAVSSLAATANAEQIAVDAKTSTLTVRVFKSGLFAAFAHDHNISAPIARGSVDAGAHKVELRFDAAALKVGASEASEKDRAEIHKTMHGPKVLDSARYPEIVFRSNAAKAAGPGSWQVQGDLTLHGQTKPVIVFVKEAAGGYTGAATLKQTDFGIKPIRIAGGTVRIKDEVRIEFDLQLTNITTQGKSSVSRR
jgi:polyisoprenoid-binding protein YceI